MENWIKRKMGLSEHELLTRQSIETYQLDRLVHTIKMAKENSSFYREHLQLIDPQSIRSLKDLEMLPFTNVTDLRQRGQEMLCVRQNEISRIVTLDTSGTTGNPKRIYFTEEDQELTIDFFHFGMMYLVDETDVVLILMPCQRPGSVGDLLNTALIRLGSKTVPYGLLDQEYKDLQHVLEIMNKEKVTSIVGTPTQVLQLTEKSERLSRAVKTRPQHDTIASQMKTVLLSAEFVPESTCNYISDLWGCKVFEHYGMTEMGLGCAVGCGQDEGYHTREADLYIEIIDPESGEVLPDGEYGEVVFTTLTRKGMPFIRYRTGDRSRWLVEPCECGSVLKRLDKVGDRGEKKGAFLLNARI